MNAVAGAVINITIKQLWDYPKIDMRSYFYGFPIRSGMTNRGKQLQAKLEAVFFSLSLSGLTRQSRDFGQLY